MRDYTLEFKVRVKSTFRDLRKCLPEAIRDKNCSKEIFDATIKDFDEIGRTYEVELTTLCIEGLVPFSHRGRVHLVEILGH